MPFKGVKTISTNYNKKMCEICAKTAFLELTGKTTTSI